MTVTDQAASKIKSKSRGIPTRRIAVERRKMSTASPQLVAPQPFLKWAGGKRSLLAEIRLRTPEYSGAYIEPFLGAGAVLFDQQPNQRKIVSDYNHNLIEVYEVIRDKPSELLDALRSHENSEAHYYEVRAWDREPGFSKLDKIARAARFIYLNKCGYNGLYRVNSRGEMNVPYGSSVNPDYINETTIRAVSEFLSQRDPEGNFYTNISAGDYRQTLEVAQAGDWVYIDPPYAPISATASFVAYSQDGFTNDDQKTLRDEVVKLTERGVFVLLSNSYVPAIEQLYTETGHFEIETVSVRRAIAASSSSRGNVDEVLVNNYKAARG